MRFPATTVEWADLAARWVWIGLGLSAAGLVLNHGRGVLSVVFTGYESVLFLSLILFPAWRDTTWLRAVAHARSTVTDKDRVLAWMRALRILTGLGFGVLILASMASFLSVGLYALLLTLAVCLTGFVIFKLLGAVHGWVSFQNADQNRPRNQASMVPSPLPRLSRWIRVVQALSLLTLIAIPRGGPLLSLSSLFDVASTATVILVPEFTLRFAHVLARRDPHPHLWPIH